MSHRDTFHRRRDAISPSWGYVGKHRAKSSFSKSRAAIVASLLTVTLAHPIPANALPSMPALPGLNPATLGGSEGREVPIYGRIPNSDFAQLFGQEPHSPGKPAQRFSEAQQRAIAESPLNGLSATPSRANQAGTLVSAKPVDLMVDHRAWNADAHQLRYNSTDSMGRASIDGAMMIVPKTEWKGSGPRPLVAIAAGTQGTNPACDPSVSTSTGPVIQVGPLNIVTPYEVIPMIEHLQRGAAIVIVDHHRNSDGNQEYVDNISSAQSLLDAAVATRELGIDASAPVGIYGYSQGGSAAAAAAERAEIYAPELNVVATAAGAPPSDLLQVLAQIDGTVLTPAIALAMNSLLDKDPALRQVVHEHLNETGRNLLATTKNYCVSGLAMHHAFETTHQYTASGEPLADIIADMPPVTTELGRQRIGNFKPNAPVFLYTGINDDVIPVEQVRALRDDWTKLGFTDLEYSEDSTPLVANKSGLNHILPMLNNLQRANEFLWSQLQ